MKLPLALAALLAASLAAGCDGSLPAAAASHRAVPAAAVPAARFAVISDLHYYDAEALGAAGDAFAEEVAADRKMVVESAEILREALRRVAASGVAFLLVSGDLTHEGERVNHQRVAALFADLEAAGVEVYVVPGNHDILNPDASAYGPEGRRPVAGVTPGEFEERYRPFGFGEAVRRDPGSLSYVAEPAPGLWVLAIDTCRYAENAPGTPPITEGRITAAGRTWIEEVLADARALGKTTIVLQHHGLVEHFARQAKSFSAYLVEDRERVARLLARGGVRVAFTGHYHAQDVVIERFPGGPFLLDVMTGSLTTVPNVRFVTMDRETMEIRSEQIRDLPSFEAAGRDFGAYARKFVHERIAAIAAETMRAMKVPSRDAAVLAPAIADAFVANYAGDERFAATERLPVRGLSLMGRVVVGVQKARIESLWDDLEPADNDLAIDLATGAWRPAR